MFEAENFQWGPAAEESFTKINQNLAKGLGNVCGFDGELLVKVIDIMQSNHNRMMDMSTTVIEFLRSVDRVRTQYEVTKKGVTSIVGKLRNDLRYPLHTVGTTDPVKFFHLLLKNNMVQGLDRAVIEEATRIVEAAKKAENTDVNQQIKEIKEACEAALAEKDAALAEFETQINDTETELASARQDLKTCQEKMEGQQEQIRLLQVELRENTSG